MEAKVTPEVRGAVQQTRRVLVKHHALVRVTH